MTCVKINRCSHCGTPYRYTASGSSTWVDHYDSKYCETCYKVVQDAIDTALDGVPVRFTNEWIETDEVTPEQLHEKIKKDSEEDEAQRAVVEHNGTLSGIGFKIKRIWPGLVRYGSGDF